MTPSRHDDAAMHIERLLVRIPGFRHLRWSEACQIASPARLAAANLSAGPHTSRFAGSGRLLA
jgi:hypothetical protein